jgi:prolyl oligopeptidase
LGPANVTEFGSTKTLEGFQSLLAMSPYHHIKPGTRYPAVLLTTGINDPTVPPWQTAKMVARLQAATASNRPILMRADPDVGHGVGSPKSKKIAELVDEVLFLEAQLGAPPLTD